MRELELAGAADADLLYLHHLSPLNEAAARACPDVPILGHVHGTELLMLERVAAGAPAGWTDAERWAERICDWAAGCERIVVSGAKGRRRAAAALDLDPDRFICVPNGFDPRFPAPRGRSPLALAPAAGRAPPGVEAGLGSRQRRLRGGRPRGAGRNGSPLLGPLHRGQAPAAAGRGLREGAPPLRRRPTALVLLGGYPGEWEGEHPIEAVERLGLADVFLAGWHSHDDLPDFLNAADLLVHASVKEQFGQVLVEAMACELPAIAIDRDGPATIVDDPDTGWLVPPDDAEAFAAAMVEAVNDPAGRRLRGKRARDKVAGRYAWHQIGLELAERAAAISRVEASPAPIESR